MDDEEAIDDVIEVVVAFYGVSAEDVTSSRRQRQVHKARCVGMYLAARSGVDAQEIGRRFGGRDPTMVHDVCRTIASEAEFDIVQTELLSSLQRRCVEAASRRD
jgi:chromosomal replication initiation ATPase DnaA